MRADETLYKLIEIYPIKKEKELPDFDWNKALNQRSELLARWETEILASTTAALNKEFKSDEFSVMVGSQYNVGMIPDKENNLGFISSYYLLTGVFFLIPVKDVYKVIFEISVMYNKNGKTLYSTPARPPTKDRFLRAYLIIQEVLKNSFQMT